MWNGYPTCWRRRIVRPPASSATSQTSASLPASGPEQDCGKDSIGNLLDSDAGSRIGGDDGPIGANPSGLRQHRLKLHSDIRRQIDLVDDKQIAAQQPRSPLARNIVAARDVDHKDPPIDQIKREGRREVVTARLEQAQFDTGKSGFEVVAGGNIQGWILADHGVRAGA